MWNELANSLDISPSNHKRNYLYDCLNASYYINKALNELDDYIDNYTCPKKSMEFYRNNVFIHSLGYYCENPNLSAEEKNNLSNIKNLGFAYHKLDNLLCKKSITVEEARTKMKAILSTMFKGMVFVLISEIEKWGILSILPLVEDKNAYIANLINDKNYSKIDFMINFVSFKIN